MDRADNIDADLLRQFSPFKLLGESSLREAATKATLVYQPKGKMLFKRDEQRRWCHWIVRGRMDLVDENYATEQLHSNDDRMLDDHVAYRRTAVATDDCTLLEIDQDDLDLILTVDQLASTSKKGDDWMTRLLRSRIFELIPPANIQSLFKKFTEITFKKGDVVITQGQPGDYFYVVKQGRLSIDRRLKNKKQKHLAEVGPGDFFGEDALVRNTPRNASITMITDGVLMRLDHEDFSTLMINPATEYVSPAEVANVIAGGEQKLTLIDVRHPKEIEGKVPSGTINVPLQILREYASRLEQDAIYVVSTRGRRAELSAFLLNQAGLDTYILRET